MDELSLYDYELPAELIAAHPLANRTDARMLVVHRADGTFSHRRVSDLPELLNAQDCLVLNDTKVLPARLFGYRSRTGGKWEGLFLGTDSRGHWKLMGQTRGKLEAGEELIVVPASSIKNSLSAEATPKEHFRLKLLSRDREGLWLAEVEPPGDPVDLLNRFGTMPLPPYMKRPVAEAADFERYQTTYARRPGAVAAPTAGLHFTPELFEECQAKQIRRTFVTLHVGVGTFRPIAVDRLSEHHMHAEWCELSSETAAAIEESKQKGGRVVAVGTTSVRTLESASREGSLKPFRGETDLFIRPGHTFARSMCYLRISIFPNRHCWFWCRRSRGWT